MVKNEGQNFSTEADVEESGGARLVSLEAQVVQFGRSNFHCFVECGGEKTDDALPRVVKPINKFRRSNFHCVLECGGQKSDGDSFRREP